METSRLPEFQERFKELRGDMPQGEFCKKIRISRPTVSLYENGERIPDAEVLRNIAKYCSVSADWLLGLSDIQTVNEDMKTAQLVTGLSEKAINTLRTFSNSQIGLLSRLFEDDLFFALVVNLDCLCDTVFALSEFYEKAKADKLPFDKLDWIYNETRLQKYEIRDAFAALLESLIPTNEKLNQVKAYLRETDWRGEYEINENGGAENG